MGAFRNIASLNPPQPRGASAGYALVVVLFTLTVLTLIFGTSSTRTLTHAERGHADALAARTAHQSAQIAAVLTELSSSERSMLVSFGGLTLQSADGLVDLNAASPILLGMLLRGYGLSDGNIAQVLERHQSWRRSGGTLLRVSDFYRISDLSAAELPDLHLFSTVHSGRAGLNLFDAPDALVTHLMGPGSSREALGATLDPALIAPGPVGKLHVLEGSTLRAVLDVRGGPHSARIIELN